MSEARAWAIYRDDDLYCVEVDRWLCQEHLRLLKPGSKHKWRMRPVSVIPRINEQNEGKDELA